MTNQSTPNHAAIVDILLDFQHYLVNEGLNPATVCSYVTDVTQFHEFLRAMGERELLPPTRLHVTRYRSHLLDRRFKVATINKKLNSLAAYDRFLNKRGILHGPIVHPRRDRISVVSGSEREVDVFSDDEISRLLFHVQNKAAPYRNRAIVETLLYTGVRVSELCETRLADLDLLTGTLRVTGKGSRYREIPLRPELAESLKHYIQTERKESAFAESPHLFLSQRASKLHRDAISRLLKRLGRETGLTVYPHKFRHTFCTNLLRKGVPLTTVAKLAGHASIQTTSQFYIHTARQDMEEAVNLL